MSTLAPWLILAGPLAIAAIARGTPGDRDPRHLADRTTAAAGGCFALALAAAGAVAAWGPVQSFTLGVAGLGFAVRLDPLSVTMALLVSFVGAVVLRYSRNYLAGDPGQARFLRTLSLTLAAVLVLVLSANLVQLFVAWVATSVGLNRLLQFYPDRQGGLLAARKKFVASRIGDLCILGAGVLLYARFGTLDIAALGAAARAAAEPGLAVPAAAVLVVVAALLKSAQLPMHGWLLEVMETPTPVSALLHAGIINAGGFLVLRMADIVVLSPGAMQTLVVVGGATALFASVVMLTQTSVKVSLAWSTIAQMGFMMLQCGLGAFAAALLHIVAHSLYKAHAFLSSGSVIDLARASWSPGPGSRPRPGLVALGLAGALALTSVVAALFGATPSAKPGVFVLGAILAMGIVHLLANALRERPNGYVMARIAALAAGICVAWFALQAGAEAITAGTLPATLPLRGPFDLAVIGLIVLAFAAVTVLQTAMVRGDASPAWRAAYVHLSNGLYINTLANRLALRLWPQRTAGAART